jgi:anhydro-N-acetylmuramic acid kinase
MRVNNTNHNVQQSHASSRTTLFREWKMPGEEKMLTIGLMSGTSMDGIDAALIETDGDRHVELLGSYSKDYDPNFKLLLRAAEYCISESKGDMDEANRRFAAFGIKKYLQNKLHMKFEKEINDKVNAACEYLNQYSLGPTLEDVIKHSTYLHGEAVKALLKETDRKSADIQLVGYHGQTMDHKPKAGYSIIVGNGQQLADDVGIPVINDFRGRDVSEGGQGAPFAPAFHQVLVNRGDKTPAVVINIGGIANITVIRNSDPTTLTGVDTGPGNGLIDRLVMQLVSEAMDKDGKYGREGTVIEAAFDALYEKSIPPRNGVNYFQLRSAKALDLKELHLVPELLPILPKEQLDGLSSDEQLKKLQDAYKALLPQEQLIVLQNACATLEAFTADSIVKGIYLHEENPKVIILAGGGWNNSVIIEQFKERVKQKFGADVEVKTADEVGWHSKSLEAQIFAYLAVRSLQGKPISYPNTTGVPQALSGGRVYVPHRGDFPIVRALIAANPQVMHGYSLLQHIPQSVPAC